MKITYETTEEVKVTKTHEVEVSDEVAERLRKEYDKLFIKVTPGQAICFGLGVAVIPAKRERRRHPYDNLADHFKHTYWLAAVATALNIPQAAVRSMVSALD